MIEKSIRKVKKTIIKIGSDMMKKKGILWCIFIINIVILLVNTSKINDVEEKLSFSTENIELAIYLEDEQTSSIPSKESGYYYDREKSNCTNGSYINWDSVSWSPVVNNMSEYKTRCEIHFTKTYTEGILNGTDPVLKDELVPVTIEENGTVKKANLESEWYSYANKNWANSVILDDQYDTLNNQGDVYGATKENGYVSFDGVDDYIDLGLENYEFTEGLTYSTIFSLNSINSNGNSDILGNWDAAGGGIFVRSTGELSINFYMNGAYQRIESSYILEVAKEYTVVVVINNETINLYLNGKLINNLAISYESIISPRPILIGANPAASGNHSDFADMNIKNVQIYDRAISEEEVSLVSEGKVANSEGLLRYVDFTNRSYEDNEIIPEEKIESYFVWIPKYRYQLWDLGNYDSLTAIDTSKVHEIPIIFGNYTTLDEREDECTTPMLSGASGNCNVGDYMTHPAFISIPSTGFWVGKFETGYDGATSITEAQQNVNDSSKVIIKPNVISWRGIQVSNAFYSSYDYQRELDSHMMKNTEWGAVAYLQHSAYGSTTNIRLNNNATYITGYQANNEPTCGLTGTNEECNRYCDDGSCNTAYPNSVLSSTTGNITGIFDMSGSAWEYVMGVMVDQNGQPMSGRSESENSGFNGSLYSGENKSDGYDFPENKYYDRYIYNTSSQSFYIRILGDATGEMGPFANITYLSITRQIGSWYQGYSISAHNSAPWFYRGGDYVGGNMVGIFVLGSPKGSVYTTASYRIVLNVN